MNSFAKTARSSLLALLALLAMSAPSIANENIVLFSGNGPVGNLDPIIRYLGLGSCCAEFPAFTAAHFAAAAAGPPATIIGQAHPAWTADLSCDPTVETVGRWVGVAIGGPPETALYAVNFNVTTQCIHSATLSICWMVDDALGSPNNPAGLYLNGNPIPAVAGGNFAAATFVGSIPVGGMLTPGANTLYLYDADIGAAVSGVDFLVRLDVVECESPVETHSWSDIKTRF
ncbi:MAG: hypothetical protein SGI90_04055 [Candidatus Eisenbacteria bacterium]|nr:hypothetical protein [Candidatus Eisenbacteria bacterium]